GAGRGALAAGRTGVVDLATAGATPTATRRTASEPIMPLPPWLAEPIPAAKKNGRALPRLPCRAKGLRSMVPRHAGQDPRSSRDDRAGRQVPHHPAPPIRNPPPPVGIPRRQGRRGRDRRGR